MLPDISQTGPKKVIYDHKKRTPSKRLIYLAKQFDEEAKKNQKYEDQRRKIICNRIGIFDTPDTFLISDKRD